MIRNFRQAKAVAVLGLALALGGCSFFSHSITWTKPGATDAQAQDDLAQCTEQAKAQTERDTTIDKDIAAANSAPSTVPESPIQGLGTYKHEQRYKQILKQCMAQLGYQEVD